MTLFNHVNCSPKELLDSMRDMANTIAQHPKPAVNELRNWTAAFQQFSQAIDSGTLHGKKFAPAQLEESLQKAVDAINLFQRNTPSGARNIDQTLVALVGALNRVMNSVAKVRSLSEIKVVRKGKKVEKVEKGKDADNREKKGQS